MIFYANVFCLVAALLILLRLGIVDLRVRLLPDLWVGGFALLGLVFHTLNSFMLLSPLALALGMGLGGGFLYVIRSVANRIYQQDTLGLGDVKLLGAAGLWLGPHYILLAITLGAFAGLMHGLGLAALHRLRTRQWPAMSHFALPAGPGFITGIVMAFFIMAIENNWWPHMLTP